MQEAPCGCRTSCLASMFICRKVPLRHVTRVCYFWVLYLDLPGVQHFRRWPKHVFFCLWCEKLLLGRKRLRRSYLFAPRSGMFACWSGIVACWSGIFACRFGEIALNTQIEQKQAVGKKHAQLPQKAIRSKKAQILSMQEGPGMGFALVAFNVNTRLIRGRTITQSFSLFWFAAIVDGDQNNRKLFCPGEKSKKHPQMNFNLINHPPPNNHPKAFPFQLVAHLLQSIPFRLVAHLLKSILL